MRLVIITAPKTRKADDMNVVASYKNWKSARSAGGNSSVMSDHYQNILNSLPASQALTGNLSGAGIYNMRAEPEETTATRIPKG